MSDIKNLFAIMFLLWARLAQSAPESLYEGRFEIEVNGQKMIVADVSSSNGHMQMNISGVALRGSKNFYGLISGESFELLSDIIPTQEINQVNLSPEDRAFLETIEFREPIDIRNVNQNSLTLVIFMHSLVRDSNGRAIDVDYRARASQPIVLKRASPTPEVWPQFCKSISFHPEKTDTTLYSRNKFSSTPVRIPGVAFALFPSEHPDLPTELVQEIRSYNLHVSDPTRIIRRVYIGKGGVLTEWQHQDTFNRIVYGERQAQMRCSQGHTYFENIDEFMQAARVLDQINKTREMDGLDPLDENSDAWANQAKTRTIEFQLGLRSFVISEVIESNQTKYFLSSKSDVVQSPSGKALRIWDLSPNASAEISSNEEWAALGDLAIVFSGPQNIFSRPIEGGENVGRRWVKSLFADLKSQGLHSKVFMVNPAALHVLANMAGALKDTIPQLRDDFTELGEDWDAIRDPQTTGAQKAMLLGMMFVTGVSVAADVVLPVPALRNARAALKQTRSAHNLAKIRLDELEKTLATMRAEGRAAHEIAEVENLIQKNRQVVSELSEIEAKTVVGINELQQARYNYTVNPNQPAAARPEYAGRSVDDLLALRQSANSETKRRIAEEIGERAARQSMTRRSGAKRQIIAESGQHRHGPDQYYVESRSVNGQNQRVHILVESKAGDFGSGQPTEEFANSLLEVRARSGVKQNYPGDALVWTDLRIKRDLNKKSKIHEQIEIKHKAQARAASLQDSSRVAKLQEEIQDLRARDSELDRQIEYWDSLRSNINNPDVVELRLFVTDVKSKKSYAFIFDRMKARYVPDPSYNQIL